MCNYASVGRGIYFIVNDQPCILNAGGYFVAVYLFLLSFLTLQLGTLGIWWLSRKLGGHRNEP